MHQLRGRLIDCTTDRKSMPSSQTDPTRRFRVTDAAMDPTRSKFRLPSQRAHHLHGLIMYGFTSAHGMHWIIHIVWIGLVGFGLSVGGAITMSYFLDCYKTQVVTVIMLVRNLVGFAITRLAHLRLRGWGSRMRSCELRGHGRCSRLRISLLGSQERDAERSCGKYGRFTQSR